MKDLRLIDDLVIPIDPMHNPFCYRYKKFHYELSKIPKETITKKQYQESLLRNKK